MGTTTKSSEFMAGYDEAVRQWNAYAGPDEFAGISLINPYVRGSDGWEGFEAAAYDLTQK